MMAKNNKQERRQVARASLRQMLRIAVIPVFLIVFAVVYSLLSPTTTEGSKEYTVEVVDDAGETVTYEGTTDAEYLSELMDELAEADEGFSYDGYDSDYGLYITAVNGLTADYDTDGAYWSIYVNGEYGQYGADSQVVTDGDVFTFSYEVYSW